MMRAVRLNAPWRWALLSLGALLALGVLLSLPAVRSGASDFLSIFRVRRFAPVDIVPVEIPFLSLEELSPFMNPEALGTIEVVTKPQTLEVADIGEAAALVDFPLRVPSSLPSGLAQGSRVAVIRGGNFSYTFDGEKLRAFLEAMGPTAPQVGMALDGVAFDFTIPSFVVTVYGDEGSFLIFGQGGSPTLQVASGVDLEALRQEVLTWYALFAPETAAQLLAIEDWESTLVVPIPPQAHWQEVRVGDEMGLLVEGDSGEGAVLLWQREGQLYGLAGRFSQGELLEVARSLY